MRRAISMTEQRQTRLEKAVQLIQDKKMSEYSSGAGLLPLMCCPEFGREEYARDPANVTGPFVPLQVMKAQVDGTIPSSKGFLEATEDEEKAVAALVYGQYTPVTSMSLFSYHTETPLSKLLQNSMLYGFHIGQVRTIKDLAPDKYMELVREGAALEASKGVKRMVKPMPAEDPGDRLVPDDAWRQVRDEVPYDVLTKKEASTRLCGYKRSVYEEPTAGDQGKSSEKRIKDDLRLVGIGRASACSELQQMSVVNALVL